ncbi:O-methyltransferase domain [Dillenia turbinata]|uniref:O-methyltransferase domain n=1 Tax=Dillenia turbinata TaxID=194707 RepID=A0AAN8VZ27_9MAGN
MATKSNHAEEEGDEEMGKKAVRLANAIVLPMVLKSALELNLIDIISSATADGGAYVSASELVDRIQSRNADGAVLLDRMLALLASHSILRCKLREASDGGHERVYGASPICKYLTRNGESGASVASFFLAQHDRIFMESWYQVTSGHTKLIMNNFLEVYKGFEGLKVLVDVGGGVGIALNMITSMYPHIQGINFDLPHVIAHASPYQGVEHVVGDMFVSVPRGDAIFLKFVLHDWGDERCLKMLRNCWAALPNNGKVIVVESICPALPETSVQANIVFEMDLVMMVHSPEGKERTEEEYEALALNSGFSRFQVVCCAYTTWVMEFHKSSTP